MIHTLLGIAVAIFIAWLVLTLIGAVAGGLIYLLWIAIIVCLAIWLVGLLRRPRRGTV